MSHSAGTRLGPYEILAPIGAGGMGEVYRARDTRLGRDVAVKVLPAQVASDVEALARFEREARAVASLNHPHILSLFDLGRQDGTAYAVTELLEGQTLRERLVTGALPPRKAVDYATQIAQALAAAHAKNVVHRDLKPENVFVSKDGHVKLLDFGLAKTTPAPLAALEPTASISLQDVQTAPGVVLGTLGYLSPEQLRGQPADARSDLFALGAVLYEMLSGRRAFAGGTAADTVNAIIGHEPPSLATSGRTVPAGLERIVLRCLEKRPEERFHSARDLAFALEALTDTSGTSAVPTASMAATPSRLGLAVLAAVAAVALGVLALFLARRPETGSLPSVRFQVTLPEGATPARFPVANSLALSADGRQLALVALTKGRPVLWVRPLDRLAATPLEGTEGAASPFWSPDGRTIAFFGGGKLKKVAAAGGPTETLCDAEFGNAGTWGPDGTILFTEWAGGRDGLYRVSARGGAPSALALRTASGPEKGFAWPAFLSDGRHFVYLSGAFGRRPTRTIAVASIDSPEARHVGLADSQPVPVAGGRLLFLREGTLLVQAFDAAGARLTGDPLPVADPVWFMKPSGSAEFAASADGRALAFRGPRPPSRLVWLDRGGHEVGGVGPPSRVDHPALSPDGGRAVFELEEPRSGSRDIWVHDLARDVRSRLTFDALGAVYPVWSRDGQRLLLGSASQGGPLQMRIRRADGSGSDEGVIATDKAQVPQDWSPDGRWILFGDVSPGRLPPRQIWLLSMEGERRIAPLESAPVSRYEGRFSPDGRWVAFVSEETGRPEVFVSPFRGPGRRQQVSTGGGLTPRWRQDGRELYYLSPDGQLMAVTLGPGMEAAHPRQLFTVGGATEGQYDVDARGERFLFCLGAAESPPVVVALGWDPQKRN